MRLSSLPRSIAQLAACALVAGVLASGGTANAAKKDDTLRFAYDQAPESVDPYFNNVRIGVIIGANVWDTLIFRDPDTNEYKGQLAKSWKQVDDRTIDFELREGIKFHNGEAFDADSVVYTLNFVGNADNKVTTQQNVNWIDKAEKLGPYKVRLTTKKVFPAAIEFLAGPVVMHPAKYYQEVGPKGMNAKPVGTGPYKVTQYTPGKSITLEKQPGLLQGVAQGRAADRQDRDPLHPGSPDPDGRSAVRRGRLHHARTQGPGRAGRQGAEPAGGQRRDDAHRLHADQFAGRHAGAAVQGHPGAQARSSTPSTARRSSRTSSAPAPACSIPTASRRSSAAPTRARRATSTTRHWRRSCWRKPGFPNGFDTQIVAYRERNQTEAIINNLQAVGISAKLSFLQYAAMRESIRANKEQLTHQTWGSFSVNDISASTPNYFAFEGEDVTRDPEVRDLLLKGNNSIDPEVRKAAYKSALTMIADRAYAVPLWSLPVFYVAAKDLAFKAYPDELVRFWEMTLEVAGPAAGCSPTR